MGKSRTIDSCQAYDYEGDYKIGLLGAIANPWVKMFMLRDKNEILVRAKAYLLQKDGEHYVVIDRFYGDSQLFEILKEKITTILNKWVNKGLIKGFSIPASEKEKPSPGEGEAFSIRGEPLEPFRAPVYTDVGFYVGGRMEGGVVEP